MLLQYNNKIELELDGSKDRWVGGFVGSKKIIFAPARTVFYGYEIFSVAVMTHCTINNAMHYWIVTH